MAKLLLTAWILRQLVRRLLSFNAAPRSYQDRTWQRRGFHVLDVPTAVALRISGHFNSVVEIGSASGDRIIAIKKGRPALRTTAMDIGPDYATDRTIDGVEFRRYAPSAIEPGSLVFCVGTLAYMSRAELSELMRYVANGHCALLLFEPQPPFQTRTSMRRASDSWYHPYGSIANDCGLTEVIDDG